MFVTEARIQHFRSIREGYWKLPDPDHPAGWHVIVGDNGSGKTSFLRALVLGLIGPETAQQLRESWDLWLAKGESTSTIALDIARDVAFDRENGMNAPRKRHQVRVQVTIERADHGQIVLNGKGGDRSLWGSGDGWFSASYGPLRRFTGGNWTGTRPLSQQRLFSKLPKLGRHLSLFDESVALTECLDWLKELRFKELEGHPEAALLGRLKTFINQEEFLPFHAQLYNISSSGVTFVDGNGAEVEIENLSDGYRSVLCMTFELIRQLAGVYGPDRVFDPTDPTRVTAPGVVLIDEIDAHLHPTWQRRIGVWLREHFPNIQFIVTTHSPIICQAADEGSVYRLPRPGFDEPGSMVQGEELKRLVYGSVLEAYGTEVFGENVTRSAHSQALLDELATLNVKELDGGLDRREQKRQQELRGILPTSAYALAEEP